MEIFYGNFSRRNYILPEPRIDFLSTHISGLSCTKGEALTTHVMHSLFAFVFFLQNEEKASRKQNFSILQMKRKKFPHQSVLAASSSAFPSLKFIEMQLTCETISGWKKSLRCNKN